MFHPRLMGPVVALAAVLAVCGSTRDAAAHDIHRTPPVQEVPELRAPSMADHAVLAEVNRVRAKYALAPLRFDKQLWTAARDHCLEQAVLGYLGSESPDPERRTVEKRVKLCGYACKCGAEVVADVHVDAKEVVQSWMEDLAQRNLPISATTIWAFL